MVDTQGHHRTTAVATEDLPRHRTVYVSEENVRLADASVAPTGYASRLFKANRPASIQLFQRGQFYRCELAAPCVADEQLKQGSAGRLSPTSQGRVVGRSRMAGEIGDVIEYIYEPEEFAGTTPPPPSYSDDVQRVLLRMNGLTQVEIDAIVTFVDGSVADGLWERVIDCYCPAFNSTDWKTGFKRYLLTVQHNNQGPVVEPVQTPGKGVDWTVSTANLIEPSTSDHNLDPNGYGVSGGYVVNTGGTESQSYWGNSRARLSWDEPLGDFFVKFNCEEHRFTVPKANMSGDVIMIGGRFATPGQFANTTLFMIPAGGSAGIVATTRLTQNQGVEWGWHGDNLFTRPQDWAGGPQTQSFLFHLGGTPEDPSGEFTNQELDTWRSRVLQFLIDLGVAGVPTP